MLMVRHRRGGICGPYTINDYCITLIDLTKLIPVTLSPMVRRNLGLMSRRNQGYAKVHESAIGKKGRLDAISFLENFLGTGR